MREWLACNEFWNGDLMTNGGMLFIGILILGIVAIEIIQKFRRQESIFF